MKKLYNLLLLLPILLLSCLGNNPNTNMEFTLEKHILDNNMILSIAFEDDGTAWLTSLYGYGDALIRIDTSGLVTAYDAETALLEPETSIRDIEVDSQGRVWIANNGLIKYENGSFVKYDTLNSILPGNIIRAIAVGNDDKIWVSSISPYSNQAGLVMIEDDVFTLYNEENSSIPSERVWDIEVDSQGNAWILSMGNFYKFNGNTWKEINVEDHGFTPSYVSDFAIDQDNRICAVMNYAISSQHYEKDVPIMSISGDNHTLVFYGEATMFPSVYIDNSNNVWLSDMLLGLKYYDGNSLRSTDIEHGASVTEVAPDGKLWVGSEDGVYIYNK